MPSWGADKAKELLQRQATTMARADEAMAPWGATVTALSGDNVTVRPDGAATGGTQIVARLAGASVAVNDRGICVPLAGGGVVFAKIGGGGGTDGTGFTTNISTDIDGSTEASPRTIGTRNFNTTGEAVRYLIGDDSHGIQVAWGRQVQFYSYWGMEILGKRIAGAPAFVNTDGNNAGLYIGSDVDYPEIAAPVTPAAGRVRFYAKADGQFYSKDDTGAEFSLSHALSEGARGILTYMDLDTTPTVASNASTTTWQEQGSFVCAFTPGTWTIYVLAIANFKNNTANAGVEFYAGVGADNGPFGGGITATANTMMTFTTYYTSGGHSGNVTVKTMYRANTAGTVTPQSVQFVVIGRRTA